MIIVIRILLGILVMLSGFIIFFTGSNYKRYITGESKEFSLLYKGMMMMLAFGVIAFFAAVMVLSVIIMLSKIAIT